MVLSSCAGARISYTTVRVDERAWIEEKDGCEKDVAGRDQQRWWLLRVEGPCIGLCIEWIRCTERRESGVMSSKEREGIGDDGNWREGLRTRLRRVLGFLIAQTY
jgi:hypothetical protein